MKFFFDRCVPIALSQMVSALESRFHQITHHDKDPRFHKTTADTEWLRVIGADDPKPIVVSGDGKILRRPAEINVLREQGLTFFLLGEEFEEMPARQQAWKFLKSWAAIIEICESLRHPSVFKVRTGSSQKVELHTLTRDLPKK
jgi:hypothetical protein